MRKHKHHKRMASKKKSDRLIRLEKIAGRAKPDRCEICNKKPKRIMFDHCHKTGLFRAWVCGLCNLIMGLAKNSPALLRKLARHLEKHSGWAKKMEPQRAD